MNGILTIAKFTLIETIKSKVLYNIFFIGLILALITFVAHQFTYGDPNRIAIDFSLGLLSLSCVGIALFFGINLLKSEIESRTIYMIISRPTSRLDFILGKIAGLSAVLVINVFLLSLMALALYLFLGGEYSNLILVQILFTFFESLILLLVVVLLSLLTNRVLTFLFSLFIYISGFAINEAAQLSFVLHRPWLQKTLAFYDYFLPGFHKFNLKDHVMHVTSVDFTYLSYASLYFVCYSSALLLLITWIFNKKSLD